MADPAPPNDRGRQLSLTVELLRIGVGLVWALNFVFIVAPANHYFGNFGQTALSFAPTTLGGPALAQFVAGNSTVFAWIVAVLTGYLMLALTFGLTTRWACLLGAIFSAVLLGTQVGSTFVFPGGTDVGEHPLYLLIYMVLVLGGAGQSLSADHWISSTLAQRRAARAARAARALPSPGRVWTGGVSLRFFAVYFVVGVVVAFAIGAGLVVALPYRSGGSPPPVGPTTTSYVNLTITLNNSTGPANGWPQYSPANITVPAGRVIFTITDDDSPMNWTVCPCVVTGTPGDVELVNGTPVHIVSPDNVAHTFNVPQLGLSIYSPGQSVVQFTANLLRNGTFVWFCMAPCGTGTSPYSSPPMNVPGFMTGNLTVT
jgi:hypothetical protein